MIKKHLLVIPFLLLLSGCAVKDQDMYAEQSYQDSQERSERKGEAFKSVVVPVVKPVAGAFAEVVGGVVVGTVEAVGQVGSAVASNPDLVLQGVKTYQQVNADYRADQARSTRLDAELKASYQPQPAAKPIVFKPEPREMPQQHNLDRYASTGQMHNNAQPKKAPEEKYIYEFIEGMAIIYRYDKTKYSDVEYGGKGPHGNITRYKSEDEALRHAGCENYRGTGTPHSYNGKRGTVYFCDKPLDTSFYNNDIAGEDDIGPGLTGYRKRWMCQKKYFQENKCKEI